MRVVMASCFKYRDTWGPFFALFEKFHGGPIDLLTDAIDFRNAPSFVTAHLEQGTWCQMLAKYAATVHEPILFFQDDFFINAPVRKHLVKRAADLVEQGAGYVRLYPCPGADHESLDPYFGGVSDTAQYRISCQTAVWSPAYLKKIADYSDGGPWDFELIGSSFSRSLPDAVFAFKREVTPWPVEYICSAVSRGVWNPDAKKLCDLHGIPIDLSMRPMATA